MGKEPITNDGKEFEVGLSDKLNGSLPESLPVDCPTTETDAASLHNDSDQIESEALEAIIPQLDAPQESEGIEDLLVSGVYQSIAKLEVIQHQLRLLNQGFDIKFKEDAHKEKIIDTLHKELQEYKSNIFSMHQRSMTMDIIKIIDDTRKFSSHYRLMDPAEWDLEKLLDYLEQIPSDLEDIFLLRGITPYQETSVSVDPARQRVARKVFTEDPLQDRMIAARLRPGYECDGRIIRPEMVAVYVYEPSANEDEAEARNSNE